MTLKVGDVCPHCRQGLLTRTPVGIACDECAFELDIASVVEENERLQTNADDYTYKPASLKIRIEDPEIGEQLLRGLIIARSNNSCPLFVDLIDAVNGLLEPWRAAKLREEMSARRAAGMG